MRFILLIIVLLSAMVAVAEDEKSVDELKDTIKNKGFEWTDRSIFCNCTSIGCDTALVNKYGSEFAGVCVTEHLCLKAFEKAMDNSVSTVYLCVMKENMLPVRIKFPFICLNHKKIMHKKIIHCCHGDFCNGKDRELKLETDPSSLPPITNSHRSVFSTLPSWFTVLIVCTVLFLVIALILLSFWIYHRGFPFIDKTTALKTSWFRCFGRNGKAGRKFPLIDDIDSTKKMIGDLMEDSGSGLGGPMLIPRTIANQITLLQPVGQGRFGEVLKGKWKGDDVAVKVFVTRDEKSYFREVDIYMTTMMRHPNILHFIASDNKDTGEMTQLWLVTEFHQNGALLDYLTTHTVSEAGACEMVRSLATGLSFLHLEIDGTHSKPAIAHRDLKSKNVLVKSDGQLCIADLGLAIRYQGGVIDLPEHLKSGRVGTVRYLAPEVLTGRIPLTIDAYRMADIYSLGLVIWEISRRTQIEGVACPDCLLPYYDTVDSQPTIDQMRIVVVDEQKRPELVPTNGSLVLQELNRAMSECWSVSPSVRNQALVVRNMIDKVKNNLPLYANSEII